ncbi:alpha/beta fold hydrolase [Sphingomonas alpina]|uniref:Alpha/beta fold hydrolase n=1 Tax=Sphingomonas alpina TaxID=653931 RepID=A0A7H0LFL9_9SPHN|nr:alpha/beta hydrolase [Sphingomonas alpina]QNQ08472.1 alpha/beta fold hydrolase [Sphingomonas alpina]
MKIQANGIELEYESHGPDGAPVVLLIMGLGAQLTLWPIQFVEDLVARGYRAIRFDNRDVGLSAKFDAAGIPNLMQIAATLFAGLKPSVPYTLDDMAADAKGLLDALGIERAHILGGSMGGMIAQIFAATYPERTLSLTSIMSTTGNPAVPQASAAAMAALTTRPTSTDLDAILAHGINVARVIGSPAYPADAELLRQRIQRDFERSFHPAGFTRQMAAIYAGGDRRKLIATIAAPTMVIHGVDDPLVPVEGGRDTAAAIPGAKLREIPGMGHDIPVALIPTILDAFEEVAREPAAA